MKRKSAKCWKSGEWASSREAAWQHLCPCGARIPVTPRHNPKVGGQTLHGWHVRVPAHKEGVKARAHPGDSESLP